MSDWNTKIIAEFRANEGSLGCARVSSSTGKVRTPAVWRA